MGQQQLILITIAFIIVGIGIAAGIMIYTDNAIDRNRDAVMSDLLNLTARAQSYYRRPHLYGGGQGSFVGLDNNLQGMRKLVNTTSYPWITDNGRYRISGAGTALRVLLNGTGNEPGRDPNSPVAVTIAVYSDSISLVTIGGPLVTN